MIILEMTIPSLLFSAVMLFMMTDSSWAAGVKASLNEQGDTIHLELLGLDQWNYNLERKKKDNQTVIEMLVPALTEQAKKSLENFKSTQISKVQVFPQSDEKQDRIDFFLKNEDLETFDYLTDQPSRLIVDFYIDEKKQKKVAKENAQNAKRNSEKDGPKKVYDNELNVDLSVKPKDTPVRKIASDGNMIAINGKESAKEISKKDRGAFTLFDGADPNFERFLVAPHQINEESVIKSQENEFLDFPALEVPLLAWQRIRANQPQFEIEPNDTLENKQARLLLTLFLSKRDLVFEKTKKWFDQKYPNSTYKELVEYLSAELKLERWQKKKKIRDFEDAINSYANIIAKYPNSPLTERTSLMIGFLYQERGDLLSAIRAFQLHRERNFKQPLESFSKDLAKMGQALAFVKIKQFGKGMELLNSIQKNSAHESLRQDASYRLGDIYFEWKKYDEAVVAYRNAIKQYPDRALDFPNSHFNQGEALFSQKKFYDSLLTHVDFLKRYPVQDFSPYVLSRVGELLQILGAEEKQYTGAFLECIFRFGENPKAIVARLRLLSQRMKQMRSKEVENAVNEIMALSKSSDLAQIDQFATLMVADGFNERKEYEKGINLLTQYYQRNPTTVSLDKFRNRIVKNISDEIHVQLDESKYIDAMKTYQKYSDTWLKSSDRLDFRYDLGRAFEMAGLEKQATDTYRNVVNQIYSIQGTKIEREKRVKERLPTSEQLNLRLAKVEYLNGKNQVAWDYIKQIKSIEPLTLTEQIERIQLTVNLLKKKGEPRSAIRYLTDILKDYEGEAGLVAGPYLQLAELELADKQADAALTSLKKIDDMMTESANVPVDVHLKALEQTIGILKQQKKDTASIPVYEKALDQYEDKKNLASMRYQLGDIYYQRGEIQKASEIWNQFKGSDAKIWKKLANEKLSQSQFSDSYKKYIQRIPAMSRAADNKTSE